MNTNALTSSELAAQRPPISLRVLFLAAGLAVVVAMQSPLVLLAARVLG